MVKPKTAGSLRKKKRKIINNKPLKLWLYSYSKHVDDFCNESSFSEKIGYEKLEPELEVVLPMAWNPFSNRYLRNGRT